MGLLDDWIIRATEVLPKEQAKEVNWAPSRWLGYVPWALVFLPISAWLTIKGRLRLASLAASPYLFPFYLLMGFLDLSRPADRQAPQ